MLINHEEYRKMFEAEERLWWYRILHEKILQQIQQQYGNDTSISILDAGCGTGGLLAFLREAGYKNSQGFDFSASAVHFSRQRNLPVNHLSITDIASHFAAQSFDVIVCNDVFYALEKRQIVQGLSDIATLLKVNGLFLTNNNAFSVFYGIHDIAVGGKHRFKLLDFQEFTKNIPIFIQYNTYWSFFLALPILLIRQWQQFLIKRNKVDIENVASDVTVPAQWLNSLFYYLMKMEEKLAKRWPFGSSLLLVFKRS